MDVSAKSSGEAPTELLAVDMVQLVRAGELALAFVKG